MTHDVFVSYHSDSSRSIADRVVREMESSGVICWYAPRNVKEKYVRDIMDAIQACSIFVVLLNKASSESEFVLDEIAEAKQSKKKIIVLQLTEEAFSKESSLYLKRHHWVKASDNLDAAIQELVDRALLNLGREKRNPDNENQIRSSEKQKQSTEKNRSSEMQNPPAKSRNLQPKSEYITLTFCGQSHRIQYKTITYKDGSVYTGEEINGKRHGIGRMTWSDQCVYEGEWTFDTRSGKGKLIWPNGDAYEGEWELDDRLGLGKMIYADGSVYEGRWILGSRDGKGKYTWTNGDVYEGDWSGDRMEGFGVFKPAKGKILKGRFEDGKFLGK